MPPYYVIITILLTNAECTSKHCTRMPVVVRVSYLTTTMVIGVNAVKATNNTSPSSMMKGMKYEHLPHFLLVTSSVIIVELYRQEHCVYRFPS